MRINEITLFTNNIQKQKHFYNSVLEFEQLIDTSNRVSFKTGESVLSFQYKKAFQPSHVAFNIPSNKEEEALHWLQKRVGILPFENELISNFESWNAKAIYFYDEDKNILEFIARKNLNIESSLTFTPQSILSISEMAIATINVENIFNKINQIRSIQIYDGDFSRFCAVGNEEGLFIIIDKNKKKWYPTMDAAFTSDFIIKGDYNFAFENGKIKELS